MNACPEQMIQQHIPALQIRVRGLTAAAQNQLAIQSQSGTSGGRLSGMIRLHGTDSKYRVCALRPRLAEKKLQFTKLVAAHAETRTIVALDIELRATQMRRKAC